MTLTDQLKAKVDELDLDTRLRELTDAGVRAYDDAKTRVGGFAHDNRHRVDAFLDRASTSVDEYTGGKYADRVTRAKDQIGHFVDKLAEQRPQDQPPTH